HNLLQYAIMGSIYSEKVRGIENPTVGLLNVGTESGKGSNLTKKAYNLMQHAPIQFIGNVESRDLLSVVADVVITVSFSGYNALKSLEGSVVHVMKQLKQTLMNNVKMKNAESLMKIDFMKFKQSLFYPDYCGAALFGLAASVIKSHGSSNARAIYH